MVDVCYSDQDVEGVVREVSAEEATDNHEDLMRLLQAMQRNESVDGGPSSVHHFRGPHHFHDTTKVFQDTTGTPVDMVLGDIGPGSVAHDRLMQVQYTDITNVIFSPFNPLSTRQMEFPICL